MAQRVSQTIRQTVVEPNPAIRVSQIARQTTLNPNTTLRVSQIVRMVVIRMPGNNQPVVFIAS